jgi:hypothetical protein
MEQKDPAKKDLPDPTFSLADYRAQCTNGSLRWVATVLAGAGLGFFAWSCFDQGEQEVFFPIHLKGRALYWVMGIATAFWLLMAVVNWKNWKKKKQIGQG